MSSTTCFWTHKEQNLSILLWAGTFNAACVSGSAAFCSPFKTFCEKANYIYGVASIEVLKDIGLLPAMLQAEAQQLHIMKPEFKHHLHSLVALLVRCLLERGTSLARSGCHSEDMQNRKRKIFERIYWRKEWKEKAQVQPISLMTTPFYQSGPVVSASEAACFWQAATVILVKMSAVWRVYQVDCE